MKTSKFNSFFPYEDKIIGYNAYKNDFTILDPELYDLFQAAERENITELEEVHPDFYNHLQEKGFVISKDVNELEQVKSLVYEIDQADNGNFHVIINPTMNCNFKCWYCYETHIKDSKMGELEIKKTLNFITRVLNQPGLKQFSLSWFGGEPLLYFNKTVLPILEKVSALCKDKGVKMLSDFTTNGLLINQDLLDKCVKFGVKHMQITLDGHRERHNKVRFISKEKGSYDEIIKNIKLSLKNGITITCRLNISKETLEDLNKIVDDFSDLDEAARKFLNFSFNRVWQEKEDLHQAMIDAMTYFKQNNFNVTYNKDIDSVRDSCYADKRHQATINYNGEVFKCTARDFNSGNKEGDLQEEGMIEWNEKFDLRMNAKFKNPPCLECKIMPICNGGCSQSALENLGKDYCVNDFDESKKLEIVKNKFLVAIS
ncbi:radical SAM/SPASM domain-containing protein [Flavobacterium soyae]|uniref:Radical SAM protein n=1 Tax=Flavobacterium soyae TaxID=2903098 RepID=A0ABZ2UHD9_9FLAO|nr:radical SAM protein [Flavobacterium soyae]MCD9574465.1 radical SAM protein [Flavobacterium soyae]